MHRIVIVLISCDFGEFFAIAHCYILGAYYFLVRDTDMDIIKRDEKDDYRRKVLVVRFGQS